MKRDIAKFIGLLAFLMLGPLVIHRYSGGGLSFLALTGGYFIIFVLVAKLSGISRLPGKYQLLGMTLMGLLSIALYSIPGLHLGMASFPNCATSIACISLSRSDPELRAREAKFWARFRNSARRAR